MSALSKFQVGSLPALPGELLYATVLGSCASDAAVDGSDIDVLGYYYPEASAFEPPYGTLRETHNSHGTKLQFAFYDIRLFYKKLLRADPVAVALLWPPEDCILHITPASKAVTAVRTKLFASTLPLIYLQQIDKLIAVVEYPYHIINLELKQKRMYHAQRLCDQVLSIMRDKKLDLSVNSSVYQKLRSGALGIDHVAASRAAVVESIGKEQWQPTSVRWDPENVNLKKELVALSQQIDGLCGGNVGLGNTSECFKF